VRVAIAVFLLAFACQRGGRAGELPGAEPFEPEIAKAIAAARPAKPAKYTNRLILEKSPYLLQHAHDPVDWRPWGEDALAAAKRLGRPILLSIGYSTCHWCHVMKRESWQDEQIAAAINRSFVAIKVDREERPDLDRAYMAAVQRITGSGGWPLTVFLLPDGRPFFGGTYFPPRDGERGHAVGLATLLAKLSAAYRDDGKQLADQAAKLVADLTPPPARGDVDGARAIETAYGELARSFDATWGGWGRAPKFPRPPVIELILRYHRRTGDPRALTMAVATLERMAGGGIHDQIGGGFHRYAVDDKWRVPHFEKMLYDNAQLASVYVEAYQASGRAELAEVARDTLDYLLRDMRSPDGAFYAASDADSEGKEGTYFVWTAAELDRIAGDDARVIREVFDVTVGGNFERGANILWRPKSVADVAARLGIEPDAVRAAIDRARPKLLAARAKRPAPFTDRKLLVAWNALAISAFARAGLVLDEPRYRDAAKTAARFVLSSARRGKRLAHGVVDGTAIGDGYLDAHAFLIAALLDLFEVDPDPAWLREAIALQRVVDTEFADDTGGYAFTSRHHETLQVRDRFEHDDAVPSGNSVAAANLLRLSELTSDDKHRKRALAVFSAHGGTLSRSPGALPRMLSAFDFQLDQPKQIVIVSPAGTPPTELLARVRRAFVPNRVLVQVEEGAHQAATIPLVPLVEGKTARGGTPTAYVCVGTYCEQPTSDPDVLARQLASTEPYRRPALP
jgi:hypothetical protein